MKTENGNIWDPAGRRGDGLPPYKVTNPYKKKLYWWCYSCNDADTRKELGAIRVTKGKHVDTLTVRHSNGGGEDYDLYEFRGGLYYVAGRTYLPGELK